MAVKLLKEKLIGKYDGVIPPILLPPGSLSDGKNVRKVSASGGWKPRKGCFTHNTTAIGSASVLSLHKFVHPRNEDFHFIAQCDSKLSDASNDPPSSGTTFGTDITNSNSISSSNPGFSALVGEDWVYVDGSPPLIWGGDSPFCRGFLSYDSSEDTYNDFTGVVIDNNSSTEGLILGASSDVLYVCAPEVAKGITLDLGNTVNSNSITATVSSWQSGAWSDRSASDGTADGGATLAQDGSLTWTASSSDTMRVLGGIMGYWYRISFSGALSSSVDVISCKVQYDLATMSNKWNGVFKSPLTVAFYDQSIGTYQDLTGKLTVESTANYFNIDSATTSDFLYVKSEIPITGIGFGIVDGYENTADSQMDSIEDWDGDSWNAITSGLIDETLDETGDTSWAQSGTLWWNAAGRTVKKRTMSFDSLPGYWYRISWDAAPSNTDSDIRLYFAAMASFPESLSPYDGVVEFKGRAMYWGDSRYPNRFRFSEKDKADSVLEPSLSYTNSFGDMNKIVNALNFYNELIVWKANSVWLLEGYSLENFGELRIASTIGCCAPKTCQVIEVGSPTMHADEPLSIAIWMDTDGIYLVDGRKPRKVSEPIRHYFDTEYSTAVSSANLATAQSFVDRLRNEYHLIFGDGTELVYNYVTDEWYPPWERRVGGSSNYLVCGINFRDTNKQYQIYGGNDAGKVFRLETDTSDKSDADADIAIEHSVKTRAISYDPNDSYSFDFVFRGVHLEAKARTTGSLTTTLYKNLSSSGTALTVPEAISLINDAEGIIIDGVDTRAEQCKYYQLKFEANMIDVEMEIYSFIYYVDVESENEL